MKYTADEGLSLDEINDLEERRVSKLDEAGINELEVLADAHENINIWNNYFNENITRGKDDVNFVFRDQWTAIERSEFTRLFKPAMTFNKLDDAVKKITGEQRKNKPDLLVRSLTGKATEEQIDLRADLVRTISYQSQNDLVYQTAFKSALTMGFGAFQLSLDYESPRSFNQVINFNMITDPTKTSFDPSAVKPHKGDGNYCSRQYIMSKEEFFATYPYIHNPDSYADPRMLLDFQWETRDTIVLCDYYVKEWFPLMIYKLSNGMSVTANQWEDMQKQYKMMKGLASDSKVVGGIITGEIPKIIRERQSQDYKIMHYRMIKNQILDFDLWPSKFLPIIYVDGNSYYKDGQQYTRSFIHEARDAQKFINYVGSEIAAEIKNRRREQWIGTPDNVVGNEQMWRNPEQQIGILIAKPDPKTGQLPQKAQPWDISQQLLAQFERGGQDIKEILGFHEEQAGQESNAQSGVAIKNRQIAGSMSAYVFFDNINQAIEQAGRCILDLLPTVYDEERHVVVSKANGVTQSIILNQKQDDGTVQNVIERGDFDIEIDTGPSFAVQKDVALQFMMQLLQVPPDSPVFPLIVDLIAKNLDVQFMPQIVERLQTLVPPQILAKEKGEPPPPPQPNPQEQAQQQQQEMAQQEMELKKQDMQIKQAQMQDRSEELQIRKQKHEMDKVQMSFDAHKLAADIEADKSYNELEKQKLMLEAHKISKSLEDSHHDREMDMHKLNQEHVHKMMDIDSDMHLAKQKTTKE